MLLTFYLRAANVFECLLFIHSTDTFERLRAELSHVLGISTEQYRHATCALGAYGLVETDKH